MKVEEFDGSVTSDDVLGKEVIDSHGAYIGIVEKVHIDPDKFELIGVSVDKGFLRKGLAIGKEYIHNVTSHAVLLNTRPAFKVKGMEVFDAKGNKLGVATKVILKGNKNHIEKIFVKSGVFKKLEIPSDFIDSIGHNVLLNKNKEKIIDYQSKSASS